MNNTEFRIGVIRPVECARQGWELIKKDYWLLFAIFFVGAIIGGFSMYILLGAMICGIFYCYLRAIDGEPVSFDNLWKGFEHFGSGLLVMAFIIVPMIFVYALIYIPIIFIALAENDLSDETKTTIFFGALTLDLIFIIVMVCFHTLLMFAFPLIVDRKLGGFDAIKLSAKAAWKNLGGVTGLILVNMGLTILGYLALCIGIYFVIPIIIATNVVAYRQVFPAREKENFNPPPPNAYQGL